MFLKKIKYNILLFSLFIISYNSFSQKEVIKKSDCIFDLETQNDDFLKGIKELQNYSWDSKTKTATIIISIDETIEIYRGGCDDFSLSAKFIVPKKITFKKNKEYIFGKILWVSKLLYDKSDYEIINECINKNKYSVDESDPNNIHINLMNNLVYNNFIIFYNNEENQFNTFSITYFIN